MSIEGSKVLIVEDDPFQRVILMEVFEEAGCTVLDAVDADDALDILGDGHGIGTVITDVHMPGELDGLGLAHAVRRDWPHVNVVVISGHIRPQSEELPEGVSFLTKPVDYPQVRKVVERLAAACV